MKHTLSTTQWQRLQDLFAEAESLDASAAEALLRKIHNAEPLLAESLAAMLQAHERWRSRTSDAIHHLVESTQVSAVGARLGAYRLDSEIGRGGMGVVYLGERVDGQVQQQVAIKVLHTRHLDDHTRMRFQRERDILAGFEHPGIARLLDAGESAAGEPYFVMEYLRGATITAHCDAQRLGIRARLQLFLQVCSAVQYAHGQLVLHRDIKPSNVLVDSAGVPKLIDFGIAKPLHDGGAIQPDETALAQRYFSPVNAAPEQIRGESVAVTCDVYQLGTLLYELLCGKPLFDLRNKTAKQVEELICDTPPTAPSDSAANSDAAIAQARGLPTTLALQRTLRGDLDAITLRAVRKEATRRYASVEQLADDVRRYLGNLPVHGRRGTTGYRLQRFAQRNWRALTVAGLAVAGIVVFAALLIRQQRATALERDNAIAERDRGEAVTKFLVDIFKVAEPSATTGPDVPIRTALKKGEELLDARKEIDPRTRARLLSTLSNINVTLSNLDVAEAQAREAVQLLEGSPGSEPLLADYYQHASGVLYMRDNMADAHTMAVAAVAIYDRFDVPLIQTYYARLNVLRTQVLSDKPAACKGLESLLEQMNQDPQAAAEGLSSVLTETKNCRPHTANGMARNEADLRAAIAFVSGRFEAGNFRLMQLRRSLAVVLIDEGRLTDASVVLQENLSQQQRLYGARSWHEAYTLYWLGVVSYEGRQFDEAERLFLQARDIFLEVHKGQTNSDLALISDALGRVQQYGYHDAAKARENYAAAVDLARETLGEQAEEMATYSANYGVLLWRQGDAEQARPFLQKAAAFLPTLDRHGARARVALATILANERDWTHATALLTDASDGIAAAVREDDLLGGEIRRVREMLPTLDSPPATGAK